VLVPPVMSAGSEVAALLSRLNLSRHAALFEEEEINDVALLTSMGPEMLNENLDELGLDADSITALSGALFPQQQSAAASPAAGDDDEDGLELEDNASAPPPMPSGAAPPLPTAPLPELPPADELPNDVTQEEIDAAEAEAQWLLNPLSMLDTTVIKERMLKYMADGVRFQKKGQPANARAAYTRAIDLEGPNNRMLAALYYNRAACQRELGQLSLALRDAQKAAEIEPTMLKAHWRAADVAVILNDDESAMEAIDAGLKQSPRCQPLLELKLKVKKF